MNLRHFCRKTAGFLLTAAILMGGTITAYAKPDWPSDVGILADSGILMDMDSGTVIFGQQIHQTFPPASITKLLTALVVAEHASLDDVVTFSHDAVYNVEAGSGNKLSLEEGDKLTVEDCLYALLLISSNQSANALAEHVAGSREAFVEMMNQKIAELGCQESHFANPSGLNDENQYVSAYDMGLIATAAFRNETVLAISSAKSYKITETINNPEGIGFKMEHRILMAGPDNPDYYCEGAVAGKTGYTSIAGNTLVTYAAREGQNLVSVILKGTQPQYYVDAKALLDFGFASVKNLNISENEPLLTAAQTVLIGDQTYQSSDLSMDDQAVITVPKEASFADVDSQIMTDIPAGAPVGAAAYLQYTYNDRKIGGVYLISASLKATEEAAASSVDGTGTEKDGQEHGTVTDSVQPSGSDKTVSKSNPENKNVSGGVPLKIVVPLLLVAVVGAAAGAAVYFLQKKKKQEAAAAAARRERRLRRLQEIGCSQEEFEKLLNERKQASVRRGKRR